MRRGAGAGSFALAMMTAIAAAPAKGQVGEVATLPDQAQTAVPSAVATPLPVPPGPAIVLPTAPPSPAAARPRAAATPIPHASTSPSSAGAADPSRANRPSLIEALPAPSPTPAATATPTPPAGPARSPTPPVPLATPSPAAPAVPRTVSAPAAGAPGSVLDYWPVALGALAVALFGFGWVARRRRREAEVEEDDLPVEGTPEAAVSPVPVVRARLALAFRPLRAGLNLLSATSENEIVVSNVGDAPAEDIRVVTQLVSAHVGQDAELAALYSSPIGRPTVPAFSLQPGEQRVLTSIAALPREAIRPLTAAGLPMFVPIVAVNLTYATADVVGQLAQAFAIGVERVDSPKLAPFWLDAAPRTFDQVAARPHAAALER